MDLKKIISHCKEYGFVFPSSDIYDGLSAVYSFYNQTYIKQGLGNFMILRLIELAREMKLKHVYLGYYIKNVDGMNYKSRFYPAEIFQDGKWIKFQN